MKKKIKIVFAILLFIIFLFIVIKIVSGESFSRCGINYQTPWWEVKNSSGSRILIIDKNGNMYINTTKNYENTAPPSFLINSLIIKSGASNKFSFNSSSAYVSGSVSRNNNSLSDGNGNDLIIKNSIGGRVAHFDGVSGNIYLKGSICSPNCGDGVIDSFEQCDGIDFGPYNCFSFGFSGGNLACYLDCTFDTSGCY